MKNILEVKEYDLITSNLLSEDSFKDLENLILTFNNTYSDAAEFFNISVRKNLGKIIQTKNYVGLIQLKNGDQINILPKIPFSDTEGTKKTFIKMIRCLKDFPSKVFTDSNLNVEKMNLYELFINMYIQEVRELLKKGLKSSYTTEENNLNCYKGKLLVNQDIKFNLAHKERIFVEYDEYNLNRAENRIIKSTLLKLQNISSSSANVREIHQLLNSFELLPPSNNYIKDFSNVSLDRNTKDYQLLMKWSKVFLMNKSFTTFSGDNKARALLFPMEKVFESYVAYNLKKLIKQIGWEISLQDHSYYLFDEPRKFALIPDIIITRRNGSKVILDTKWKALLNNANKNYGISQMDMYQMFTYSKKYNSSEVWLLYPITEEMKNMNIEFRSYINESIDVKISLFFIDVTNIEENLEKLVLLLNLETQHKVSNFK